ncbi:MAG: hypothetical protein RR630_05955 [Coprobacillus sp.]
MGFLNIFKKENYIKHINVSHNYIEFDNVRIDFPASLEDVAKVLDLNDAEKMEYEEHCEYVFHKQGIILRTCDYKGVYLKYRKAFIDNQHNFVYVYIYCGNHVEKMVSENALPKQTCKAVITFNQKPASQYFHYFNRTQIDMFSAYYYKKEEGDISNSNQESSNIALSFNPPRPHSDTNYKIKPCHEEVLEFDNFNFKLCILQVLIYDLELLTPYFDIDDFADWYSGKEIDTESPTPIKPVINYFKKLPIPKRLAEYVSEINMDGGNDIYMNIAPQWSGADEIFDLSDISEKELLQFPQLKKVTLMSNQYDKLSSFLKSKGIEVNSL